MAAGRVKPDMGEINVRGGSDSALEQPDQLEDGQIGNGGEIAEQKIFGKSLAHQIGDLADQDAVARRGLDAIAPAAAAAEQIAEGGNQQFVLAETVGACFERLVQRQKTAHEVGIRKYVTGEIRH